MLFTAPPATQLLSALHCFTRCVAPITWSPCLWPSLRPCLFIDSSLLIVGMYAQPTSRRLERAKQAETPLTCRKWDWCLPSPCACNRSQHVAPLSPPNTHPYRTGAAINTFPRLALNRRLEYSWRGSPLHPNPMQVVGRNLFCGRLRCRH